MLFHQIPWRPLKVLVEAVFVILSGAISIADVFLYVQYRDYLSFEKISILLGTDPRTVKEFLTLYAWQPKVLIPLICVLALLGKGLQAIHRMVIPDKAWRGILTIIGISIVSFVPIFVVQSHKAYAITGLKPELMAEVFQSGVMPNLPEVYTLADIHKSYQENGSASQSIAGMDKTIDQEEVETLKPAIPYVVFVLGESLDRNHMSAYGYQLDTTPFLDKRATNGELAIFDDTISPANSTAAAMSRIFTYAQKESDNNWYEYADMLDIMKKAGYDVTWLSNQDPYSRFGSSDYIFGTRSDRAYFVREVNGLQGGEIALDEAILPILDKTQAELSSIDKDKFYILHLEGDHEPYDKRYPDSFARFVADDEPASTAHRQQIQATYDNSILYGDWVLEQILSRFESENAIVIFISDHGSDPCTTSDFCGHAGENTRNRHMVEVPFMIWGSHRFREQNPQLWTRIMSSVHRPYRTDDLMHTMFDILGIRTTHYDASRSVINDEFIERDRIYGGIPY